MTISSTDLAVGLLSERSANEWLREAGKRAAPRMLFGEFGRDVHAAMFKAGVSIGEIRAPAT